MGTNFYKELKMPKRKPKRKPLFKCVECNKKFYTVKAAENASYGAKGCPGCGGADIEPCF